MHATTPVAGPTARPSAHQMTHPTVRPPTGVASARRPRPGMTGRVRPSGRGAGLLAGVLLDPVPAGSGRRRTLAAAALLAAAGVVVSCVRQPGRALDSLWAEDGSVFLTGAYAHRWWEQLLTPYNGYAAVYPRLVAALAGHVPVADAAAVMALGGALACGVAVFLTVLGAEGHLPGLGSRAVLGVGVAAFPLAGQDLAASSCNAHFYLILATFWCLLWRPRGRPGRVLGTLVPLAAAASDPLTGLLLPLGALRVLAPGPRSRVLPVVGLGVGLLAQTGTLLTPTLTVTPTHPSPARLLETWVYRGPDLALVGPAQALRAGPVGLAVSGLLLVAALGVAVRSRRPAGSLALAAAASSLVLFAVPIAIRWSAADEPFQQVTLRSRFTLLPASLCLVVLAAATAAAVAPAGGRGRLLGRAGVLALAVLVVVPCVAGLRSGRQRVPSVSAQLPALTASCASATRAVGTPGDAVGEGGRVSAGGAGVGAVRTLHIAPGPAWTVLVPCARLVGTHRGVRA